MKILHGHKQMVVEFIQRQRNRVSALNFKLVTAVLH